MSFITANPGGDPRKRDGVQQRERFSWKRRRSAVQVTDDDAADEVIPIVAHPAVAVLPATLVFISVSTLSRYLLRWMRRLASRQDNIAPSAETTVATTDITPPTADTIVDTALNESAWLPPPVNGTPSPQQIPPVQLQNLLLLKSYRCTPAQLRQCMFHPSGTFLTELAVETSMIDVSSTPWQVIQAGGAASATRDVLYKLPLHSRIGPSHAHTTESQSLEISSPYLWTARIIASTPNVPLGSRFHTEVLFTAWVPTPGTTCLKVTGMPFFPRHVGPLRGLVSKETVKGLLRTYRSVDVVISRSFEGVDVSAEALAVLDSALAGGELIPSATMTESVMPPTEQQVVTTSDTQAAPQVGTLRNHLAPTPGIMLAASTAILTYVLVFLLFPGFCSPEAQKLAFALLHRILHPSFPVPGITPHVP